MKSHDQDFFSRNLKKIQITDILEKVTTLKWYWVGHMTRQEPKSCTTRIIGNVGEVGPQRDSVVMFE